MSNMNAANTRLLGMRFGSLRVLCFWDTAPGWNIRWLCQCSCGVRTIVSGKSLSYGNTKSCGCYRREKAIKDSTRHGMVGTGEHNSWRGILQRCNNPKSNTYHKYGAKGVKVCDRWLSFELFYSDMGPKPTPHHSIDRMDGTGDYCPENCRWATKVEQANNTKSNKYLTINGLSLTTAEWGRKTKQSPMRITGRVCRGWPDDEAVFGRKPPVDPRCRVAILFDHSLYSKCFPS